MAVTCKSAFDCDGCQIDAVQKWLECAGKALAQHVSADGHSGHASEGAAEMERRHMGNACQRGHVPAIRRLCRYGFFDPVHSASVVGFAAVVRVIDQDQSL